MDRHPATTQMLGLFDSDYLPDHVHPVSGPCAELAREMVDALPDGPELTAALRKLLEARDCFVRQAILAAKDDR